MIKTVKNQFPGPLHALACYVLLCMENSLNAREKEDFTLNHRLRFKDIFLFVCEMIRMQKPPIGLGMQVKYVHNGRRIDFEPYTMDLVIWQCMDLGLFLKPGEGKNECNYDLTSAGKDLAEKLAREGKYENKAVNMEVFIFDQKLQKQVQNKINEIIRIPIIKRNKKFLDLIADIFLSPIAVAHSDISDKSLKYYLEGVAARAGD